MARGTPAPEPEDGQGLRTPSLRRRVTLAVLALVAVMLLAVGTVTDVVLENRLDHQLRDRLSDRAGIASALVDRVDARDLARRLEGDGVSVVLRAASGQVYAEGPLAGAAVAGDAAVEGAQAPTGRAAGRADPPPGPAAKAPVVQDGDRLSVTRTLSDGSRVTLLADASDVARTLDQVRLALALAAAVVLLGAAVAVPWVVGRSLRPLGRFTDVARSITAGDRDRRLRPVTPGTELGRTAVAFDDMLDAVVGAEDRARGSESRLRDFLSDAAHELRTPLTGVQLTAEHLLRDEPSRGEREQALLALMRESRRASRLVDDMLTMARIDTGLVLERSPVDLRHLAEEAAQTRVHVRPDVELRSQGPAATAVGDRDRLTQVLGNLLDNAVRAAASSVETCTWEASYDVGVTVRDDGPGVAEEHRVEVFERLVRLDDARSAQTGGAGLGLAIARGIARAHGGDLTCHEREDGRRGAEFRLRLPRSKPQLGSQET